MLALSLTLKGTEVGVETAGMDRELVVEPSPVVEAHHLELLRLVQLPVTRRV